MKEQIVIFFDGHFAKIDIELLVENEFDVDFNGQMKVRFLNTVGSPMAINAIDGYGSNIQSKVAFKDAELYFKQ